MIGTYRYAIRRGPKTYGIENLDLLRDLANRRKIVPQDFIYSYERGEWIRAGYLFDLFDIFNFQSHGGLVSGPPPKERLSAPELMESEKVGLKDGSSRLTAPQYRAHRSPPRASSPPASKLATDLSRLFDDVLPEQRHPVPVEEEFELSDEKFYEALQSTGYHPKTATSLIGEEEIVDMDSAEKRRWMPVSGTTVALLALLVIAVAGAFGFYAGKALNEDNIPRFAVLELSESGWSARPLPIRDIN